MKALCFHEHGNLDVLQYADVPDPTSRPGQVLIQVRVCALNHLDVWVRRGWPGLKLNMPDDWDYPQAAAPRLVGLTAWRMLFKRADLRAGESALIVA